MHLSKVITAIVVIWTLWAVPSEASWQYTRWGMSAAEVVVASNGTAEIIKNPQLNDKPNVRLVDGTYRSGDYRFLSRFFFSEQELVEVVLYLDRPVENCDKLSKDLHGTYGSPATKTVLGGDRWEIVNENNIIEMDAVMHEANFMCIIKYKQLVTKSAQGL